MKAVWRTQIGTGSIENQDSAFVDPNMRFFIVADGVGGEPGGAIASSVAVNTISRTLASELNRVTGFMELEFAVLHSIQRANLEIRNISFADVHFSKMATTIAVAAIYGENLMVANVGDTRVYAMIDGRLCLLSRDHNAATELVGHRLLGLEQLRSHPFRNIITRSLGVSQHVPPSTNRAAVEKIGTLLLCTDGVWSVLRDPEIFRSLNNNVTPEEKCHEILNSAAIGGSKDDLTSILVDFHRSP